MDSTAANRANEALGIVCEISNILGTGLDKETLSILIGLLESGVNPEALAAVVRELRREAAAAATAATPAITNKVIYSFNPCICSRTLRALKQALQAMRSHIILNFPYWKEQLGWLIDFSWTVKFSKRTDWRLGQDDLVLRWEVHSSSEDADLLAGSDFRGVQSMLVVFQLISILSFEDATEGILNPGSQFESRYGARL